VRPDSRTEEGDQGADCVGLAARSKAVDRADPIQVVKFYSSPKALTIIRKEECQYRSFTREM